MSAGEENIDEILTELGLGKFHFINFGVILFAVIASAQAFLSHIFTARDTSYRCLIEECESNVTVFEQAWLSIAIPFHDGTPQRCERFSALTITDSCQTIIFDNTTIIPCSDYIYGSGDTIVKGFHIPCEDWKRSLVGTINNAGQLVSLLYSGILSDKYGRRNVMLIMTATSCLFGLIQSFSPNYTFFVILEFLNLAASSGAYTVIYVLAIEILRPPQRILGSATIDISYATAALILGFLAWATPSWRWLLRAIIIPAFLLPLSFFVIPECFRWLYSKGRKKECVDILKKAAKINNVEFSDESNALMQKMIDEEIDISKQDDFATDSAIKENASFLSILKSPRLTIRLLICSFCWFTSILVFYGLSLNSVNISSGEENVYTNYILVGLMDIPAIILYLILSRFTGRKIVMFFSLLSSGSFCVIYAFTHNVSGAVALILYMLSKMFSVISLSMSLMMTTELFPTSLRNTSMNFCSVVGRFGGAVAPQIPLLIKVHRSLPMIIYGFFPLVCSVLILALPETKNKRLPDTIEEAIKM